MLRRFSILASLLLVLLLAPSHSLSGEQSGRKQDWDKILDSYSELCNECIELKLRSEAGEKLSQRSVSKLFARLEELRDNLSGAESQMSEEQRRRFESIKRRYVQAFSPAPQEREAGELGTEQSNVQSKAQSVEQSKAQSKEQSRSGGAKSSERQSSGGNLGKGESIAQSVEMKITREKVALPLVSASFNTEAEHYSESSIPAPKAQLKMENREGKDAAYHFDVLALASVIPAPGASLALSFTPDGFPVGCYLKATSNFISPRSCAYGCLSNGSSGEGKVWLSGEQSRSLWQLSGGASFSVSESLCLCAGLGYGSFLLSWEDISGSWVKVEDLSFGGAVIEAGAVWRLKQFSLGAFVGTTRFRSLNLEFGLGLCF